MKMRGVGIDAVEIARFKRLDTAAGKRFLEKTFTRRERDYCLSYKDSATHFAGTFAAKEAVQKAAGLTKLDPTLLEIVRTKEGKPEAWIRGKRSKNILVSISHEKTFAFAVAAF